MKKLFALPKNRKASLIVLFLIMVVLYLLVFGYSAEFNNSEAQKIEYTDEAMVDGADFSLFVNLLVFGANGIISVVFFFVAVAIIFIMVLISLLLLVPWRLTAIRKSSVVTETEYETAKIMYIVFVSASFITALICSEFSGLFYIIFLTAVPSLLLLFLSVLPLKEAYEKTISPAQTQEEVFTTSQ